MKRQVPEITRSQYSIQAIDTIFSRPVFKSTDFIAASKIPKDSATRLLGTLYKHQILVIAREGKGRRPAVYVFPKLIAITEGVPFETLR